ncbi:hypothetical protein [Bartonella sp. CL434QHHD]|uniref:hypothetical protein n=1 Tax=Bartonella sp. CL434QHHD TaxID=3243529 RepID=UPI0035CFC8F8
MDKPILINSNEILLVAYDKDQHIAESGPLDAIQIFRINPSENNCEDISEEIAEAYVKENIEHLHEDSEVYDFVRESDVYQELLDEIADEKYNDEIYGTYEQQHRLRVCDVL